MGVIIASAAVDAVVARAAIEAAVPGMTDQRIVAGIAGDGNKSRIRQAQDSRVDDF